jgi:hypothetical protein
MKFCFTIDALSAAGNEAWRLMADEQRWRTATFAEDVQSQDARLTEDEIVRGWMGRRLSRDKQLGLKPREKPGMFDFLMRGIFAHAIVHRFSPAPVPDKDQLASTMAKAQPGCPWLVYLDLAGHFQALDTRHESIIANTHIAVRGEIASSQDYIGPKAAEDAILVDEIYRQFLAGWYTHLVSRRLGIFVPDAEKLEDEDQLRKKILAWKHE